MKNKKLFLTIAASMCVVTALAGCGTNPSTSTQTSTEPQTSEYVGPYSIKLTAIGSTTINVSKTVTIRSSVTGTTDKDVTWSSSDNTIATVEKGIVTGLKAGEVTITATLDIDTNCKKSIKITVLEAVKPSTLTITGYDSLTQWADETLQLGLVADKPDASLLATWESSNENIATVDEGLVTFKDKGSVTITATSKEDSSVKATVTFAVSKGFFFSDKGSPYWDLSKSAGDDPYVFIEDETPAGYHSLYFKTSKTTRYYAEVTFEIQSSLSSWVWQGIGLGHGLSEDSTRYFMFSPVVDGQGNSYQKCIVKTLPNESWPAITTRSQIWGQNGLNNIDVTKPIKLSTVRDGNDYYYLINDKLFYFDNTTDYDGVGTYPILSAIDEQVKAYNFNYIEDEQEITSILSQEKYKKSFFSSDDNIVYYDTDKEFTFTSVTTLSKDHKVMSLGDKAKVYGDFDIEFDFKSLKFGTTHLDQGFTGLTVNFTKYENPDNIDSFMIGRTKEQDGNENVIGRFATWNYQQSMDSPGAISTWLETSAAVTSDPLGTNHVKISRRINNSKSTLTMYVNGQQCNFDVLSYPDDTMVTRYTNAYLIWVAGEYSSSVVSNFTIKLIEE